MNLFEIQERLKDFSKDQLVKEMQLPSGSAPPFLVLSELQRRTRMEQAMRADGQGQPQSTVAEDAVNAAGVPQGGLQDMARALAPQTDMTQNTGAAPVQAMQEGGQVRSGSEQLQSVFDQIFSGGATSPVAPQIMSYADRVAQLPARTPPAAFTPSMPVMPTAPMPDMSGMDVSALAALQQSAPDLATRQAALEAMKALQGPAGGFNTGNAPTLFGYAFQPLKETGRAAGGLVRYQQGGLVDMATRVSTDPAVVAMANRMGMSVQEYLSELEPEARRQLVRNAEQPGRTTGTALDAGAQDLLPPAREAAVPEGAVTFEEWQGMTRAQREAEGLPVSELGGQLRFNRFMQGFGADETTLMPTPLEYGPPRRLPIREAEAPVNPMLEFQENFDYQGLPARVPSLPAVSPEGLQETIDAGRLPVNPMLEFQENFDYQGAPTFGPVREPSTTGTPLQIPPGGVQELLPPPQKTEPPRRPPAGPAGTGPTGVPANAQMTDNERMLNQDKWLALARVGLGLMASQAPTFGQALGEAGMAGVEALQSARADYLERKQAEELMAMRRAAGASGGRGSSLTPNQFVSLAQSRLEAARAGLEDLALGGIRTAQEAIAAGRGAEFNQLQSEIGLAQRTLDSIYQSLGFPTAGGGPSGPSYDLTS